MGPKAEMNMLVGARPTPRSSLEVRSASGKLLPRKCPDRSLVPTKTICSRCIRSSTLEPDHCAALLRARLKSLSSIPFPQIKTMRPQDVEELGVVDGLERKARRLPGRDGLGRDHCVQDGLLDGL